MKSASGDSLPYSYKGATLAQIVKDMQRVVLTLFRLRLKDAGNTLTHGTQDDTNSCGICMANVVEHALFGSELFVHWQRQYWHAYYFNKLVEAHNNAVSSISQQMRSATLTCKLDTTPPH